jgi:hypothetical protein
MYFIVNEYNEYIGVKMICTLEVLFIGYNNVYISVNFFFSSFIKTESNITNYFQREATNTSKAGGKFNMIRFCAITVHDTVSLYVSQL